jgi:voltage-gated potassium channel
MLNIPQSSKVVLRLFYEVFILLTVVTYAIIIFADPTDHPFLTVELVQQIDYALIAVFGIEYLIRLMLAQNKLRFISKNWFDLVALMPVDSHFLLIRLLRILRLIRLIKASPFLWGVVSSPQMRIIFSFVAIILLWSSAGIYILESGVNKAVNSYSDALWWAIVTTTTVGYGDISPMTEGGRIIAAFLMLTGIGLISTLTANLANHSISFFDSLHKPNGHHRHAPYDDTAATSETDRAKRMHQQMKESAIHSIQRIETLSDAEYKTLLKTLEMLRRNK